METLKNVIKDGLALAIVGILLASAAPYMGEAMGAMNLLSAAGVEMAKHAGTAPLWTGAFFGGFGALYAAIGPAFKGMFGGSEAEESRQKSVISKEHSCEKGLTITNLQMQPDIRLAADVDVDAKANIVGGQENIVDSKAKANFLAQLLDAKDAEKPEQSLIPR